MPIFPDAGIVGSVKGQAGIINAFGASGVNPVEAFNYGATLVRGFQATKMGRAHRRSRPWAIRPMPGPRRK